MKTQPILRQLATPLLLGLLLLGRSVEMGATYYIALMIASVFGLRQQYLIRDREPDRCIDAFLNNAWLGGTVFAGIALDYIFRGPPTPAG